MELTLPEFTEEVGWVLAVIIIILIIFTASMIEKGPDEKHK